MKKLGTVEPLLTATSHGRPPCLQRLFTLAQTALYSGLYFRNPCYVTTSLLLRIMAITSPPTNLRTIDWYPAHN